MTLIERLERLTGPCRECDCLIALDAGWDIPHHMAPMPKLYEQFGFEWLVNAATEYDSAYNGLPTYTASIDAAMTLKPDDAWLEIKGPRKYLNIPSPVPNHWSAHLAKWNHESSAMGWGATPAIALCIAALKAVQS